MSEMVRTWDVETVDEFIKPESQQKSPEVFRETHVNIDKIRAEILRPHSGDDAFVTEDEFRDAVLQSDLEDDNRIFIVKGEVGSGKSHLCQWLEYEINGYSEEDRGYDSEHVAIHISRSNTRLDEILEILHEPIDKDFEEISDISSLDPPQVADFIIQGLRTFYKDTGPLRSFDLESFIEQRPHADDFREILIDNIKEYQQSVAQENQEQDIKEFLLSREDYGRICISAFGDSKREDDIYPVIRRHVHDLLTRNIGIEDFKGELEDISDAYVEAGKRPVLICEDLTTFSVLKDDLLDHIFELSSGHYDVILGWTTGWESENIEDALSTSEDSLTYMRQRTQGYVSMTDDQTGEAYFLEGESAPVVLVRSYLDAIKKHSNKDHDVNEDAFDSLYPFNTAFVRHIYENLVQDGNLQQTPRILLVHVIAECLTSDVPPFKAVQNNSYVRQRPYLIDINEHTPDCQELTQWYGMEHDGELWLPHGVFESFDVDFGSADVHEGNVFFNPNITIRNVTIISQNPDLDKAVKIDKPDQEPSQTDDTSAEPDEQAKTTDEPDEVDQPPEPDDSRVDVPPEDLREFQGWLLEGSDYASADRFRTGILETLERWEDPTRLSNENSTANNTMGVYYASGSNPPVVVKGADAPSSMAFEVQHGTEYEDIYTQMLIRGYSDSFQNDANFDKLRGWAIDQIVEYRHRMRDDIEDHLPSEMTIEQFVVLANFLLMNLGQGRTEITRQLMFEPYEMRDTSPVSMRSNIEIDLPDGLKESFDQVGRHSNDIQSLVRGFFLLKRNVVDCGRLDEAIQGVEEHLDEYISELATTSVEDMFKAYRVGTTRTNADKNLATLIKDISNLAAELEKLEQQFDSVDLWEEIADYRKYHHIGHTEEDLADYYNHLEHAVGTLGLIHQERWGNAGDRLQDSEQSIDLGDFRSTLKTIEEAEDDSVVQSIALLHEYQRSKNDCAAWETYEALNEMVDELAEVEGSEVGDFKEQVKNSSEFEFFITQRNSLQNTIEEHQ